MHTHFNCSNCFIRRIIVVFVFIMRIDPRAVLATVTAVTLGTVVVHSAQKEDERRMRRRFIKISRGRRSGHGRMEVRYIRRRALRYT